jgi:hypothetical protein
VSGLCDEAGRVSRFRADESDCLLRAKKSADEAWSGDFESDVEEI